MDEPLVEPVPRTLVGAIIREMATFVPILGDLLSLIEAVEAFKANKPELGLIYLLGSAGPGPPLPLTHVIAYYIGKGGKPFPK